jgi:hypothetical protein
MKNYIEIEIYCLRDNYESWTSARTTSWSWHHDREKKKKKRTANIWFPREYSEQVHNLFFIININIRLIYVYFN